MLEVAQLLVPIAAHAAEHHFLDARGDTDFITTLRKRIRLSSSIAAAANASRMKRQQVARCRVRRSPATRPTDDSR